MPGLINNNTSTSVVQDSAPDLTVAPSKTFYGFRFDNTTGKLTVEKISNDGVIRLPVTNVVKETDYKHWLWSENELNFYWDSGDDPDRLLVEVR